MAKAKSNTALEKPRQLEDWEQQLANDARDKRSKEQQGVPRITHQAGVIKIDDKPVQGNRLTVAIIDYIHRKEFYLNPYQPGVAQTPGCYAMGREEKGMVPHDQVPDKQNPDCGTCRHNQFGTAEVGRGKRCKDTRALMVISPLLDENGRPKMDPDAVQKAEVRQLSIPPASLKAWSQYLNGLQGATRTGSESEMLVQISTTPGHSGGHTLTFTQAGLVPPAMLQAIVAKRKQVEGALFAPFPNIAAEETEKAPVRKARSNRKLD